jgi:flagellar biosynthesis protein FlhG
MGERNARVIALASGKGGVGKTNLAVNLTLALARAGRRAMLVDCDLGVANAAILLGLNAALTIEDYIAGQVPLESVVAEGPSGMLVVPGGSGNGAMPVIERAERRRLADGFRPYADSLDYLIVDSPSGIARQTLSVMAASDRVLLVLSAEPTAFMDAYATLKLLTLEHGCTNISVVANMVDHEAAGRELFRRFRDVAARFLPSEPHYLGSVPRDEHVRVAVLHKRACVEAFPEARASTAMMRLARALDQLAMPVALGGQRFFGMEAVHAVQ